MKFYTNMLNHKSRFLNKADCVKCGLEGKSCSQSDTSFTGLIDHALSIVYFDAL